MLVCAKQISPLGAGPKGKPERMWFWVAVECRLKRMTLGSDIVRDEVYVITYEYKTYYFNETKCYVV